MKAIFYEERDIPKALENYQKAASLEHAKYLIGLKYPAEPESRVSLSFLTHQE
jgi:hypothetical protein